ncbi:hypothetical protein [Roseinatronobacter alkalisoli]|uniref:Uncharacterized protein n=1 Tax=Roseinatronobacter alkalisoli TaxID=3028235 RepID=A0ABT5TBS2_9RHOB|nr:hypothetical protein [Roseinatronobacter sp. HJB301]MDD7971373.1 hypothetical protein [Roseinatronobacter sp. HJB301]
MTRTLIAAASCLIALPALADEHGRYVYADFEVSVPHIDLAECPDGLATGDVICRVTMNDDALHVYVFEAEGERPFIAVHSYYDEDFDLVLTK